MSAKHATSTELAPPVIKPFFVIALFAVACVALSYLPSPWWDGTLLDIRVRWPEEFAAIGLTNAPAPAAVEESPGVDQPGEVLPSTEVLAQINEELLAQKRAAEEAARRELAEKERQEENLAAEKRAEIQKENQKLIAQLDLSKPAIPLQNPCVAKDASGECRIYALDHFFKQLREVALKKSERPVRISQYGDSLISGDGLTGRIRARMQKKFGYGGHGYIPPTVPARFMGFQGVRVSSDSDWSIDSISKSKKKRKLGFGGASFRPSGPVSLRIREYDDSRQFTRVGVILDPQTAAAPLKIEAKTKDGEAEKTISPEKFKDGIAWVDLPPTSDVTLSDFSPKTNYYAVFAENKGGVVVDNVGMLSARTTSLLAMDAAYWAEQLNARAPDLVSFSFGTNSATLHKPSQKWLDNYSRVYQSILSTSTGGKAKRNCLVLSILTRGYKDEEGEVHERDSVKPLVAAQKEAAMKSGCAFWDMNDAIAKDGPEGWYTRRPQLIGSDFTHPTRAGYKKLGDLFYDALIYEFVQYLKRES